MPPGCSGWTVPGFRTLTVVSGRFRLAGGVPALLARFGAVSKTGGVRYWSVSAKRWETLVKEAHALDASGRPRADFAAGELVAGREVSFSQADNGAGATVFRMKVVSLEAQRVVLSVENAAAISYMLVPLFRPGELQTLYVLTQEDGDTWRYGSLTRSGAGASRMTDGHEASGINRAVAVFRHTAGVAYDQEPPAAP